MEGECVARLKEFDPRCWGLPTSIRIANEVSVWGRRWIVQQSSLDGVGLGLSACEDIPVPEGKTVDLFPYGGPVYDRPTWLLLTEEHQELHPYSLGLENGYKGYKCPLSERRYIDGDPVHSSNIAGYINSTLGLKGGSKRKNVEWEFREDARNCDYVLEGREVEFMVLTVAT